MRIEQTVEIAAPPSRIWDVTVDLAQWPRWNPTVSRVEVLDAGPVRPGLRARLTQPGNRPAVWTVTRVDEGRWFEWRTAPLGMRVDAIHDIRPTETGTHVTLAIEIGGWTAPILGWIVARVSRKFLPMEAKALQERCTAA